MRKIRPVGGFFPLDRAGFVQNPCKWAYIRPQWLPILKAIQQVYADRLGTALHSTWIRGSMARGITTEEVSDIDTFALLRQNEFMHWQEASWQGAETARLRQRFPNIGEVEFVLNSFHKPLQEVNRRLSMLVATQSMPISGEDIRPLLPRFRPGNDMMLYRQWLAKDLNALEARDQIDDSDCKRMTKALLRAGLELVGERIGEFTPDLYWCYQAFSRYYPVRSGAMLQMLYYYLNPTVDSERAKANILKLGKWILDEFQRQSY